MLKIYTACRSLYEEQPVNPKKYAINVFHISCSSETSISNVIYVELHSRSNLYILDITLEQIAKDVQLAYDKLNIHPSSLSSPTLQAPMLDLD